MSYKIGASVAALVEVGTLSDDHTDPHPTTFQEYSEIVGTDLNGASIEAGLPRCTWHWDELDAKGFDALCDQFAAASGVRYITTRTNVYSGSAYTFQNYLCVMARPKGETIPNKRYANVEVQFTMLELQTP